MISLYNGDAIEIMDKLIADGVKVDAIITDPPYGTTACKWDSVIPFEPMWERLHKLVKDNGAIVLFGSEPFSSALRMSNIKRYRYDWVWDKKKPGNIFLAKRQPMKVFEMISVFSKEPHLYIPIMEKREKIKYTKNYGTGEAIGGNRKPESKTYKFTEKYPKAIIQVSNANQKGKVHPTQKPVALMEYLIKTYTNEGETVLDFTMGSGSTGVAAVKMGRNFIGIELDSDYYNIARERINEAARP